ncbi:hypothetical protein J6O48_06070 [bacterium]|nr:hypothetical protein [bacterium]
MSNFKILDCTLRDGGYLNNWDFGKENIYHIIQSLIESKIDYIEYGFLTNTATDNNSLFRNLSDIKNYPIAKKCALMFNFGEVDGKKISPCFDIDIEIRIAFKKHHLDSLPKFLSILEAKNIKYSLNPMHTSLYNNNEMHKLINISNEFNPTCLTAVDTMGIMTPTDVNTIFSKFDAELNQDTPVGFHSHNNLDLSFNNVKTLIEMDLNREIIIDTSLLGIGRGGGMLETEALSEFLNKKYKTSYDVLLLSKTCNDIIRPIINKQSFKDKYPYYISAKNKCHPNYATFLLNHNITDCSTIDKILSSIPEDYKMIYNPDILKNVTLIK